jgi:hypothetical protein
MASSSTDSSEVPFVPFEGAEFPFARKHVQNVISYKLYGMGPDEETIFGAALDRTTGKYLSTADTITIEDKQITIGYFFIHAHNELDCLAIDQHRGKLTTIFQHQQ